MKRRLDWIWISLWVVVAFLVLFLLCGPAHAVPLVNGSRICKTDRVAYAGIDVDYTQLTADSDIFIIAIGIDSNDERCEGGAVDWQFRTGADAFEQITTTSTIRFSDTTALVHDTVIPTSDRRATGGGTYVESTKEYETANSLTFSARVENGDFTETQVGITVAFAVDSTQYDFRLLADCDTADVALVSLAQLTTNAAAAVTPQLIIVGPK